MFLRHPCPGAPATGTDSTRSLYHRCVLVVSARGLENSKFLFWFSGSFFGGPNRIRRVCPQIQRRARHRCFPQIVGVRLKDLSQAHLCISSGQLMSDHFEDQCSS